MHQIAFLFLILDNPNFPKIWDSYFRGNKDKYNIYIHSKQKEKTLWKSKNIIEKIQETSWGHIVSAYIELFREAYKNPNNMKFLTISESDIPIKSFDTFYDDCISDKRSWIKFLKIKNYNWKERINKQPNQNKPKHFIKHLARFCLNREHVGELLQKSKEKQLEFFYKMHVGDEFFLSVLYPLKNYKDFDVTFDDWEYVDQLKKISKFKVYNEEGINEKYPSKVWNWDINEFGKYNPTTKTFTMFMDGDGYADYMDTEFPNWLKNEKIADKGTKKYREDIKNAVEEEYGPGITINGEGFSY